MNLRALVRMQLGKPECGRNACPDVPEGEQYCEKCPRAWLEDAGRSGSGALLRRTLDLDFALRQRVQIRMAEIPFDEWEALKILDSERRKHQEDEAARERA